MLIAALDQGGIGAKPAPVMVCLIYSQKFPLVQSALGLERQSLVWRNRTMHKLMTPCAAKDWRQNGRR